MRNNSIRTARLERHTTPRGAETAVLTIDHPPRNLFEPVLWEALIAHIASLQQAPPRAVLVRAEGPVVCGGADVAAFEGRDAAGAVELWRDLHSRIIAPLEALPCPVVFAAHALTLTAGVEIALACDLIVAHPRAQFGFVETVVALTPSMGGVQRLAGRAGAGRARQMVLTGELYGAATLHNWGVVDILAEDTDREARMLTDRLADGGTRAHAATKSIVAAWSSGGLAAADAITAQVAGALFDTADARDAIRSFLEVGPGRARFTGR
ncbi:enoyl-CoA hydratase/isomerase family protein [Nocardia asteroides]|uniref:enoyl-CoA hydratase/isomerase family protein n=1 Tax=Nocardia asteroides TaxID=1824 RepID=UPI001E5E9AD4|nr:enoyl-CoA hydratase/isomerase family protein [Nocardia asteroides]UGT60376.1 enoyl-CoA hydratase/isomerase family protein [Nocardia asteroides]